MRRWNFWAPLAFSAAVGCTGVETATIDTSIEQNLWTIKGAVSDSELADGSVYAVSTSGALSTSTIGADGHFEVAVPGGASYALHFAKGDEFKGLLTFPRNTNGDESTGIFHLPARIAASSRFATQSGALEEAAGTPTDSEQTSEGQEASSGTEAAGQAPEGTEPTAPASSDDLPGESSEAPASDTEGEIDLGEIAMEDGQATPENAPTEFVDSDGDGTVDAEDDDDDNDGVPDGLDNQDMSIPSDSLPFAVVSATPGKDAPYVDEDSTFEIRLTRAVDSETVSTDTVVLRNQNGETIAAAVSLDDDGLEIHVQPVDSLQEGDSGSLTVTSEVSSVDGEALTDDFVVDYTVGSAPDFDSDGTPTALEIKKVIPLNDANEVQLDAELKVLFNLALAPESIEGNTDCFQVIAPDGAHVDGVITFHNKMLRFQPDALLEPTSEYTALIGAGLTSMAGGSLESVLTVSFTTRKPKGGKGNSKVSSTGTDPALADDNQEDDEDNHVAPSPSPNQPAHAGGSNNKGNGGKSETTNGQDTDDEDQEVDGDDTDQVEDDDNAMGEDAPPSPPTNNPPQSQRANGGKKESATGGTDSDDDVQEPASGGAGQNNSQGNQAGGPPEKRKGKKESSEGDDSADQNDATDEQAGEE